MTTINRSLRSILLLMLLATLWLHAQQSEPTDTTHRVRYDSSQITVRRPGSDRLDRYRNDKEFRYDTNPKQLLTIWERFKAWLQSLLWGTTMSLAPFWEIIGYTIFGLGLVFVILKLIGIDPRGMFYRGSKKSGIDFQVADENIHAMDFDTLIADAVRKREYRRAIRLHYMQSLKGMTDRQLITWRPDKTNHDYLHELSNANLKSPFERVTTIFEYAWYGDFPVGEEIFRIAEKEFGMFHRQLIGASEAV